MPDFETRRREFLAVDDVVSNDEVDFETIRREFLAMNDVVCNDDDDNRMKEVDDDSTSSWLTKGPMQLVLALCGMSTAYLMTPIGNDAFQHHDLHIKLQLVFNCVVVSISVGLIFHSKYTKDNPGCDHHGYRMSALSLDVLFFFLSVLIGTIVNLSPASSFPAKPWLTLLIVVPIVAVLSPLMIIAAKKRRQSTVKEVNKHVHREISEDNQSNAPKIQSYHDAVENFFSPQFQKVWKLEIPQPSHNSFRLTTAHRDDSSFSWLDTGPTQLVLALGGTSATFLNNIIGKDAFDHHDVLVKSQVVLNYVVVSISVGLVIHSKLIKDNPSCDCYAYRMLALSLDVLFFFISMFVGTVVNLSLESSFPAKPWLTLLIVFPIVVLLLLPLMIAAAKNRRQPTTKEATNMGLYRCAAVTPRILDLKGGQPATKEAIATKLKCLTHLKFVDYQLLVLSFLFMTYNALEGLLRADNYGSVVFVLTAYTSLLLLFWCLQEFDKTPEQATKKKERLRVAIGAQAMILNLSFTHRVATILDSTVMPVVVWTTATVMTVGGFYSLFFVPEVTERQ